MDDEEAEEESRAVTKVDILDDPVRMYLKQMGQVPLLTRDQEVEISKRIEEAEAMVQKYLTRFGFVARGHLDLARKLLEGRERFDRVILDKKIESRERYMKNLPRLCKQVEQLSAAITRRFAELVATWRRERPRSGGIAKNDGHFAKDLPSFLSEADGHRGVASRRRGAPYIALSSDRACKKSSGAKNAGCSFGARSASWKRACGFNFRLCTGISNAEKLAASGV